MWGLLLQLYLVVCWKIIEYIRVLVIFKNMKLLRVIRKLNKLLINIDFVVVWGGNYEYEICLI